MGFYTLTRKLATLCLFFYVVKSQYVQEWTWRTSPGGSTQEMWWGPTANGPQEKVEQLPPYIVYLEYNCYYMTAICQNANTFLISARGASRKPRKAFAYDFNHDRATRRRVRVCPSGRRGWTSRHTCPEIASSGNQAQPDVFRADGLPWYTTALEPNLPYLAGSVLRHRRSNGQIVEQSGVKYTCDEFPPATWIQGGSGLRNAEPSYTRCAGFRCGRLEGGRDAEQNWQAAGHNQLRRTLITLAGNCIPSWTESSDSPLMFYFRMVNEENDTPVRIYEADTSTDTEREVATTPLGTRSARERVQELRKRSLKDYMEWADTVPLHELSSHGFAVKTHHIFKNRSSAPMELDNSAWGMFQHMNYSRSNVAARDNTERANDWSFEMGTTGGFRQKDRHFEFERGDSFSSRTDSADSTLLSDTDALAKNFTTARIAAATRIVEEALNRSAEHNQARWKNMSRNQYRLKPGTIVGGSGDILNPVLGKKRSVLDFVVTPEIEEAAALLTEFEAFGMSTNNQTTTGHNATDQVGIASAAAAGSFWMETITRKGTVPWGNDPSYKVFRNVKDYGAKGDGKTDDTAAIKKAMDEGKRCGKGCNGSSTKNAIVYFPQGTYLISTVIPVYFGTQLIGDATKWPTIVASSRFIGTAALSTNEYTGGGTGIDGGDQEWYVNTASFYRQIRNFKIDVTQTRAASQVACIHNQVGQATSLQFLELTAKSGTKQRGIASENGSGGVLADITFKGGAYGSWGGSQQFTVQRMVFDGCATAVHLIWDWSFTWKSITIKNADIGFKLLPEEKTSTANPTKRATQENGNIGSTMILDSTFSNVGTAILIGPLNSAPGSGSTGLVLENIAMSGVQKAVADSSGKTILASTAKIDQWVAGPTYSPKREFSMGKSTTYKKPSGLLDSKGAYFERAKPQYEDKSASDFVHLKNFGAKGDGVTDDTSAVQSALWAAKGKILHVDAGTYILKRTVTIPSGSKLVGETWSQFAASGSFFGDANNPKAMLSVGNPGDVGEVEMQDLMFTTKGATPGAILVQWNIKASKPGSAGIWDCHVRIGGAAGTSLNPDECPPVTSGVNANCQGASLMMHITPKASGYFENMWLWVADHMIDDADVVDPNSPMTQTSVYVARGLLVESQSPTWMYGTASEHAVFYQYNFNKAKNIFAGMIQTESPYYQPTPKAPAPFEKAVGKFSGDPKYRCDGKDFDGCDSSWAVMIRESSDIIIGGAGLYSWFSTYTQDCIDGQTCQKALLWLEKNGRNIRVHHLITIGAKYSLVQDGRGIAAKDNLNVEGHPRWSQITVFEASKNEIHWIDPKIWDMDEPTVWCEPPCQLKLPPWEKSTTTLNYPVVTATGEGWTTAITNSPVTVTQWVMEVLTVGGGASGAAAVTAKARRDEVITSVKPTFTSTPVWPSLVFRGGDGKQSTTRPAKPTHPGPPDWPSNALVVKRGAPSPVVDQCSYYDPDCSAGGWDGQWTFGGMDDPSVEETLEDDGLPCPSPTEEESSTPTPTPTPTPKPPTVEFDIPDTKNNKRRCYHVGQWTSHYRIKDAANHLCGLIKSRGRLGPGDIVKQTFSYPYDQSELGAIGVETSLEVKAGCEFVYSDAACDRYVNVPIDSCNCAGENGKQGGEVENNCYKWRLDPEKEA